MNTWFRKVGMGALALTLAGVLGGCNNGDGGGALVRLFFGINGDGNCTQVIVDVNLDDADAVIARDDLGDVQCVINSVLDNAGCDITFTELENGDLRAVISGCTIPEVVNLFSCLFEDVDISELQETASAQCSCTQPGCDENPPVCISLDPDPESCEDCDNGIDDDGNGLEDCEDPNCRNAPECILTTTTSTTSTTETIDTTTTTNTTSTTVTTTTTLGDAEFNCTITFELIDDLEDIGALQWDTFYGDSPGEFLGLNGDVECSNLVEDTFEEFNDCENSECEFFPQKDNTLISGIITDEGFSGPTNLSECTFRTTIIPVEADFTITVTSAADTDLDEITPLPDVEIASIDCDGVTTTTTTTLPPDTTTTTEEGPTTTTTIPVGNVTYILTFNLDTASAPLGALQWSVNYADTPGDFTGTGGDVECDELIDDVLFAPNDFTRCSIRPTGGACDTEDAGYPNNCQVCDENEDCNVCDGGAEDGEQCDDGGDCPDGVCLTGDDGFGTCSITQRLLRLGIVGEEGFSAPQPVVECEFVAPAGDPPVPADFPIVIEDVTDEDNDPATATMSVEIEPAP